MGEMDDKTLKFIMYFPLLFCLFKFSYPVLFWNYSSSIRECKIIDLVGILLSIVCMTIYNLSNEYLSLIISFAFISSIPGKYSDYLRQKRRNNLLLIYDSSLVVVVFLFFKEFNISVIYIYFVLLLYSLYIIFRKENIENFDLDLSLRVKILTAVYTTYFIQLLFFYLFEDFISVEYLFVWRILVSAGAFGSLIVKFLPSQSLSSSRKFQFYSNFISFFGVLVESVYLYFDPKIDLNSYLILIIFMLLYQSFRFNMSKNVMLLSRASYKPILLRIFVLLLIIFCSYRLFSYFNNMIYITLPLIYLLVSILDYKITKKLL